MALAREGGYAVMRNILDEYAMLALPGTHVERSTDGLQPQEQQITTF